MPIEPFEDVEIRINFERGTGDPTRIFRTMTGLIEATQSLDSHLAVSVGSSVRTSLVLQDIEASSLKAKLRAVVNSLPDEALKNGEIKKVIGHYLLSAKHKVLDWCDERDEIRSRSEVVKLQSDIHALAESSDVKLLPAYAPVELPTLLSDITTIREAMSHLSVNDDASFSSANGLSKFNPRLVVSGVVFRELVVRDVISARGERILKVKKPDYLGMSKWEFKYGGHAIEAKLLDQAWLSRFQSSQELVRPGDSLRVVLREEVAYGYDGEIVHTEYEILKVLGILPGPLGVQGEIDM